MQTCSRRESVIWKPMQETSVWYSSRAQCCVFLWSYCLPHSVCSTQSVWYLLCYRKPFTSAAYANNLHCQSCRNMWSFSHWELMMGQPNTESHTAWLMGSGMRLKLDSVVELCCLTVQRCTFPVKVITAQLTDFLLRIFCKSLCWTLLKVPFLFLCVFAVVLRFDSGLTRVQNNWYWNDVSIIAAV